MLGAIIGDIAGSRFEWHNHKSKDFELLAPACSFTDDSVMTVAAADALLTADREGLDPAACAQASMQRFGRLYPNAGYGGMFFRWLGSADPKPYHSFGNGAAMRVSPVAMAAETEEDVKRLSAAITGITHDHPEGLRGAEAAAMAGFLARRGESMAAIRDRITADYYPLGFTLDAIRPIYRFDVTCQGSVPVALEAFLESTGFEDAVRNAVSVGGDSDTIAAITGGIAELFWGIPEDIRKKALTFLTAPMLDVLDRFEERYGAGKQQ